MTTVVSPWLGRADPASRAGGTPRVGSARRVGRPPAPTSAVRPIPGNLDLGWSLRMNQKTQGISQVAAKPPPKPGVASSCRLLTPDGPPYNSYTSSSLVWSFLASGEEPRWHERIVQVGDRLRGGSFRSHSPKFKSILIGKGRGFVPALASDKANNPLAVRCPCTPVWPEVASV